MDFFKKFKKPTQNTVVNAALASAAIGTTVLGGPNQPATTQEALQKDTVNPIPPKEYVEKKPALTLTKQAEKAGIKIDTETVPENGYNAADHIITPRGEIQPVTRVTKEPDPVSDEQIAGDMQILEKAVDGQTIYDSTIISNPEVDKDSSPEKTPNSQSSEGLNSEVTAFEIPSDPEEAKKFADKVITILLDLLKKFPGALTGKNALLLTTIATSGLQAANDADAANLSAVYNNLNPDSTYVKSLSSEEALRYKASQIYLDYLRWQEKNMFKQDLSFLTLKKYAEELDLDEAAYQAVVEAEKRFKKNTERASLYRIKHSSGSISSNSILKKTGLGSNYKSINQMPPLSYNTSPVAFPKKQGVWQDDGFGEAKYTGPSSTETEITKPGGHPGDLDVGGVSSDRK